MTQYKITKVQCALSNGANVSVYPLAFHMGPFCNDLEHYRKAVTDEMNARLSIMNIEVDSVYLTYEEHE